MYKRIAFILALVILFSFTPAIRDSEAAADYSWIKVKLTTNNATAITMAASGSYFIQENGKGFTGGSLYVRSEFDGTLTVTHSREGELYRGKSFSLMRASIDRDAGAINLNGRNYLGHFNIRVTSNGYLQVVNVVPLAHYLYGVVGYEMSDTFPLEALKAQAVAAKCYVLSGITTSGEYYIGDTSTDQVYKGYDAYARNVIKAVDSTLDKVLTYKGSILRTYYAASNGGETKLVSDAWGSSQSNAGYSVSIDDYDFQNVYSLKETAFFPVGGGNMSPEIYNYLLSLASTKLNASVKSVDYIISIEAKSPRYSSVSRDMTKGHVEMMVTLGNSGSGGSGSGFDFFDSPSTPSEGGEQVQVSADFYLSDLYYYGVFRNASLRIYWGEPVKNGYNIYHVRWGHGVGLSQRGAQQRAIAGHSYEQILNFYYPGAQLSTMTVSPPSNPERPLPVTGPGVQGITTGTVNFRAAPSSSADKLGTIPKGSVITVYAQENGWAAVVYNNVFGYVSMDYIELAGEPAATPLPTSGAATPGASLPVSAYGVVTGSGVNFRSGPSTSYPSIAKLDKGTQLEIYEQVGSWYHAAAKGMTGYITSSYVKITETPKTPEPTAEPTVTPSAEPSDTLPPAKDITYSTGLVTGTGVNFRDKPSTSSGAVLAKLSKNTSLLIWSKSGSWYYASAGNMTGYIHSDYVKITGTYNAPVVPTPGMTPEPPGTGDPIGTGITTGNVNFRKGPSTSDKKITQLKKGTKLTLYALSDGWYEAEVNGTHGFVSAKYVSVVSGGPDTSETIGATTGRVNFRTAPSTSSGQVIRLLPKGTEFTILGETGDWYKVNVDGQTGFVIKAYVKIMKSGSSPVPVTDGSDSQLLNGRPAKTNGTVYFRQSPSTEYGVIIAELPPGTKIVVYQISGDWCLVSVGSTLGYIHKSYVDL